MFLFQKARNYDKGNFGKQLGGKAVLVLSPVKQTTVARVISKRGSKYLFYNNNNINNNNNKRI